MSARGVSVQGLIPFQFLPAEEPMHLSELKNLHVSQLLEMATQYEGDKSFLCCLIKVTRRKRRSNP